MFLKSRLFQFVSVSVLILGLAVFAFADTIRLKDGSVIKGKIISFDNGQFVIVIGEGARQRQMRFFADEIESIKFDSEVFSNTSDTTSGGDSSNREPNYTRTNDDGNTVITVGSAPRNAPPANSSNNPNDSNSSDENDVTDSGDTAPTDRNVRPIQIKVKVLADNTANGWTNAGWVVRKGQRIRIAGSGRISLGNGRYSAPGGITTLPDAQKLIKDQPTGGLIAVIGDDNNDFIFVGDSQEFVAARDGALFLGVNEGVLDDNSGSFEVTIEVFPN